MKKKLFVECREDPDFIVYDFSDPRLTEIAPGSHALFAFLKFENHSSSMFPNLSRGALICTYRPDDQPQPPDLVSRENQLPVSTRCATDEQLREKRGRLLQLALIEEPLADLPISSRYKLVERAAKPASSVDGAWLGGRLRWIGDPLSIDIPCLFRICMDVLNANLGDPRQEMMDVASFYGFIDAPVRDVGPCGFCLARSR